VRQTRGGPATRARSRVTEESLEPGRRLVPNVEKGAAAARLGAVDMKGADTSDGSSRDGGAPMEFTVEDLLELGLPLYLNEDWLRGEVARLGSVAAVAAKHRYPFEDLLLQARTFGLFADALRAEEAPRPRAEAAPVEPARAPRRASRAEVARVEAPSDATPAAPVDKAWLQRELRKYGTFSGV